MTASESSRTHVDGLIAELLDACAPPHNRDLLRSILRTAVGLAGDDTDRLDLKITSAALREMRDAYRAFAPYRDIPKVTIFGSARTRPDDPLYVATRELAADLAARDWMVITGAGPGIMAAGIEGAGRSHSFGVNIRLPFEQMANEIIAGDDKLIEMRYFFTRKLMLIKESQAFVALPGGFGTLDETFELLTLQQTGKAPPAPIVLLDTPGGRYWSRWRDFLVEQAAGAGLISPDDVELFTITDDRHEAAETISRFYRNYHSNRFVRDHLILRLRRAPSDDELAEINSRFGFICVSGEITRVPTSAAELGDDDMVELPRLGLHFDRVSFAGLMRLIRYLNALPSAPSDSAPPPMPLGHIGPPPT